MIDRVDCLVIGAGVVGLAVARACALAGLETIVVEAESAIGTGTSSRNSEVIHTGLYYAPGSLKARLCVRGRDLLYHYCRTHGVAHDRCGKLIVATHDGQIAQLRQLEQRAHRNGVDDIHWLTAAQACRLEPELHCIAALASPSTGIIDSHGLMRSLQGDFEAAGGMVALCSTVTGGTLHAGRGVMLRVAENRHRNADAPTHAHRAHPAAPPSATPGQTTDIIAQYVFNCAGLSASAVAACMDGMPDACIPTIRYAKGNYYGYSGRNPFSRLIYPVPEPAGLGVHLTLDLNRQIRFGPDVEWIDTVDYTVAPGRARQFYGSIRRYWPGLPDGALRPDYAGIRPKIQAPAGTETDFLIQGIETHGIPGLVHLYGIESPGLTASLAIAEHALAVAGIRP